MFKQSIKLTGQVAPIICVMVDSQCVLVDGLHRLQEAIANKLPIIDVVITEGDMVDVLTKNIFIDHLRGKTPPSEMRKVIEALYTEYKVDIEGIQAKTGLTRDYVEKLLVISELTPMCLEALDTERIGVGHAFELTKIKDPVRQEVVLQQLLTYHWTVKGLSDYIKQVEAIVEGAQEAPAPAIERQVATVACHFCHNQFLPNELASVICCHTCAGIMYEAIAVATREVPKNAVPNSA